MGRIIPNNQILNTSNENLINNIKGEEYRQAIFKGLHQRFEVSLGLNQLSEKPYEPLFRQRIRIRVKNRKLERRKCRFDFGFDKDAKLTGRYWHSPTKNLY